MQQTRVKLRRVIKNDRLLFYTFGAILIKSLLLLAALHAPDSSGLQLNKMFYNIQAVGSYLMLIVFLVSIGLLFKEKGRSRYAIGLNLAIGLLLFGDLVYYRAYAAFPSIRFLVHPNGFNPFDYNLWAYIRPYDFLFLIDIAVLLYVCYRAKRVGGRQARHRKPIMAVALMLVAVVSYDHYRIDVKETAGGRADFLKISWVPYQSISTMSPIGYHLNDVWRLLFGETKQRQLTDQEIAEVQDWFEKKQEKLPDNEFKGMLKGKNVIFLQVESLESFVLGERVSGQEITPTLNRLQRNSIHFDQFYEQINQGTSSDGDLLATTSTYPVREGSTFYRYPTNSFPASLPKLFESQGYTAISSHPEPAGNWNWVEAHHNIGYKISWDLPKFDASEKIGLGLSDRSYLNQLAAKIKDQPSPFLLHFVTLTNHGPFDLPAKERMLKLDPDFDATILGDYFQSVNYTDKQIGAFLDTLDREGILTNSVVVIYGDHSGVHRYYPGKVDSIPKLENEAWRQRTLKLPLMIYSKGMEARKIDTIGGQIDILPTVAYLMGIDEKAYAGMTMGKNLLKTERSYVLLNDDTIVGEPPTEELKKHMQQSHRIADLLLESNYWAQTKGNTGSAHQASP